MEKIGNKQNWFIHPPKSDLQIKNILDMLIHTESV